MTAGRSFASPPLSAVLPDESEAARISGLAARARTGTHAIFASRVLSIFVTFATITILSRVIPPADFGLWAMAVFALSLTAIAAEMGLASVIQQAGSITPQQRDAYFWASAAASIAAACVLALGAPFLAYLYDAPLLKWVLWVGCASLVLNGLAVVHSALLRRELQYDKLALIEGGGMLCSLTIGLVTAFWWRDVWALVAASVAQSTWACAAALTLYRWTPGRPSRRSPRINLSFGLQVATHRFLVHAGNNVGMVAGYRFGATDLGFFNRGQQVSLLANYAFLTPITDVGLSLLCRLKQDGTYRAAYGALVRRVSLVFIPLAAVLPIVSADLVLALLGPNWAPAGPILAWFGPVALGQAIASSFALLMTSQGRGKELRRWAVIDLILRAGGAFAGSPFGIAGVAAGFSLVTLLVTVPLMLWIAGRSGPVKARDQLVAMWPGALLAAAGVAGAVLALAMVKALSISEGWAGLLFVGGSAALSWGMLCFALRPAREALLGRSFVHG